MNEDVKKRLESEIEATNLDLSKAEQDNDQKMRAELEAKLRYLLSQYKHFCG